MNEEENKKTVFDAYSALGSGNGAKYLEYLSDNILCTLYGNHRLSGVYQNKQEILERMVPLFREKLTAPPRLHIKTILAEGDIVIIEMEGEGKAKDGRDYNNHYCFFVKVKNGKIIETREHMDTELVKNIFN